MQRGEQPGSGGGKKRLKGGEGSGAVWRLLALAIGHQLKKTPAEVGAMRPEEFAQCVVFYCDPQRQEDMDLRMPRLPRGALAGASEDARLERQARAWAAARGKVVKRGKGAKDESRRYRG